MAAWGREGAQAAEPFVIAARWCGPGPDEGGWMMGGNPPTDSAGAREAGLRGVWPGRVSEGVVPDAGDRLSSGSPGG
ncbi:hypothetical protein GCM10018952_31290 [Streptosporangium vulgare]